MLTTAGKLRVCASAAPTEMPNPIQRIVIKQFHGLATLSSTVGASTMVSSRQQARHFISPYRQSLRGVGRP